MDIFAEQARVRGSTRVLVALFIAAVLAIVFAVDMLAMLVFGHWHIHRALPYVKPLLSIATIATVVLILGCAWYRIASLSEGGKAVAEDVGGEPVPPDTQDPQLRQLRNVIEEVAIASGTPVPDIYLLPNEPGINAFAAGYSASDAAICVTQGCLDQLNRNELQGVIAHEFSHVLNGDMRLNIRLMGLLYGIMALSVIGRQMVWWNSDSSSYRRNNDDDNRLPVSLLIGIALVVIGSIGYFFGRLIQSAVARSRETLADTSAVQFTRQTIGIAGALKKIAVLTEGSRLQVGNRHEVAHMMFGDVDDFNAWFATHPPLMERIRHLEPWFKEQELTKLEAQMQASSSNSQSDEAGNATEADADQSHAPLEWPGQTTGAAVLAAPAVTTPQAAAPVEQAAQQAAVAQRDVFGRLREAVRQPEPALALMLALAVSRQDDLQSKQKRLIAGAFGDDVQFSVGKFAADAATLPPTSRLPLLSLAYPALKQLPQGRQQTLLETLDTVVSMDPQVDLHDYCLVRLLRMHLREACRPRSAPVDGQKKLPACRDSVALVCAVVAVYGSNDDAAARRAWLLAIDQAFPGAAASWQTLPIEWQVPFDRALDDLDGLMPTAKEIVIQSLLSAIRADGVVTPTEAELLRVICASLHCAVPPQA
ncbi:M48 family metallopeptidase [Dyella flagellata]|uniref:Zn-dependent protease n=1 Tax=Dyella flagellata TaxID=1867833 RepID=A0ABQ5X7U3_9GAMM|nr:M48 family metallopeptidase [Dyella flagellata]GLQ87650.1 Zn-dependent protease [Dyella flagellata]